MKLLESDIRQKKVTIEQRVSGAEHKTARSEISKEESEDNRHGYH